ncbi:dihydrofolate reductase family protein [Amycolatopsis australiensis]|uniref:Dihydrofolate reductase n=1 Tax=Amycolatopsis australiensis TaxID=546364 RepID=A0A1K1QBV0_9PSEU|nr:dihydrofolate reductase family protein [Amycolatopsis australiensis]SFW57177.1 Dihydrofolate reductase [Amycolatopsis australiensis]
MRNVILYVNLTLDGHLAGPAGELDWMLFDPEMNIALSGEMRSRVDTILTGRAFHHGIEENFRAQASDPASPAELVDFATWMISTPQVVFSRSLAEVAAPHRLAGEDLAAEVAALKALPGKDMVLFGGVSIVQQFVRAGLVDEYWIKLYPTAIGAGQPLFTEQRTRLELVDSKAWASGILTLRYRPAR